MGIAIHIGDESFPSWSLYNWVMYCHIFDATHIIGQRVDDVIPYLDYRIHWLKIQGYDEKNYEVTHFGDWTDEFKRRQPSPRDNHFDARNDFVLKSGFLRMLLTLRNMCSKADPESLVRTDREYSGTKVDLVATREIVNYPWGPYPVDCILSKQGISAPCRRIVISYIFDTNGPIRSVTEAKSTNAHSSTEPIAHIKFGSLLSRLSPEQLRDNCNPS
jgi:hypothetical protein